MTFPEQPYASGQPDVLEPSTYDQNNEAPALSAPPSFVARLGAELFGSFLLVFVGIALAVYSSQLDVGILGVAFGVGLALMAGLATVGHLSGHFNPAITLGSALAGRTQWRDVLPLWLTQLVGGAIAAAVIFLTLPTSLFGSGKFAESARGLMDRAANGFDDHAPLHTLPRSEFFEQAMAQGIPRAQIDSALASGQEGLPTWPTIPLASALVIEVVATALFVGVFLAVTSKMSRVRNVPVVVGLTFTVLLLIAMPFTNGSLNPARSFSAAIFAQTWALGQLWLFFAAPLLGAAIAGVVYRLAIVRPAPVLAGQDALDPAADYALDTEVDDVTASETDAAIAAETDAAIAAEEDEVIAGTTDPLGDDVLADADEDADDETGRGPGKA